VLVTGGAYEITSDIPVVAYQYNPLHFSTADTSGEIYSYTIARKPAGPVFAADVPYVIAMIALDEGPRMLTNIVTKDVERVAIGDRVTVRFDDVTAELTLPKFTLDKD
jgi:uncharacterized OB-fold protein